MTPEEARIAIRTALREVAPDGDLDRLSDDADIQETLELDSLDFLRLVELLSEATGVRIDEEDYPRLATMATATAWLSTVDLAA
jgi:acyl carrier protein